MSLSFLIPYPAFKVGEYEKKMIYHIFVNFLIVSFYEKVKDKGVFLIRIKFHLGRAKGRGKRGYGQESLNEGYFCKIPIIKQDINFISQMFGQTYF